MKKIPYLIFICCSAILFCFSSCSKIDDEESYEGGIEIRMRNANNGNDVLDLLAISTPHTSPFTFAYAQLSITSSNNFALRAGGGTTSSIVCVGNVKDLGKITDIPNSGWTNSDIAVKPGYGYIIKHRYYEEFYEGYVIDTCYYARIYVVDWIVSTSGGILGATIRYQDNWK
jgi:hypothetical protein